MKTIKASLRMSDSKKSGIRFQSHINSLQIFALTVILLLVLCVQLVFAQGVVIGESTGLTPDANAILDLRSASATRGFLVPQLASWSGGSPGAGAKGLLYFNTTSNLFNFWNTSTWVSLAPTASPTFTGTVTISSTSNQMVLGSGNTTTISSTAPGGNRTYTIPDFGANGVIPIGTAGNSISLTTTGATNVTLPTSGTLATIGVLINVQIFTSTTQTAYSPTSGTRSACFFLLGGGGGGGAGGSVATGNRMGPGGGGGSGSYAIYDIPDVTAVGTINLQCGAGGGSATAGGNTTLITTSPAYTVTAIGGGAGNVGTTTNGAVVIIGGAGGAVATNGSVNAMGNHGEPGIGLSATLGISGNGADSPLGGGGLGRKTHGVGNNASGYGSGGGGGCQITTGAIVNGGSGSAGIIIIYEYK
jgi:hypothetical protein